MDRYTAHVSGDLAHLSATLDVVEAPGGAIAGIARLPDLGGLSIAASVDGPIGALATKAAIEAGQLRARLDGTLDIAALGANLSFSVVAPAMAPRQGIAWSSIRLTGAMHGPFNAPEASGMLAVDGLIAEGATIGTLRAAVSGSAGGDTTLHASLDGLRVPGPSPDILGGGPLTLDATARMGAVGRPVRFAVRHKVFSADGTADTAGVGSARIEVALPDLAPFAPFDGIDAHGHAVVDAGATRSGSTTDVTAKAEIGIDNAASLGTFLVPGLIGDTGTIDLAASLHGDDIRLSHLTFKGSAFDGSASGQLVDRKVDLDWAVSLPDMHVFRPAIAGAISAHGHVGGSPEALALTGDAAGDISAGAGEHLEPFAAHLTIAGLPNSPAGRLTASGSILNAPLWLAIDAERPNGGLRIVVDRAAWKSLNASGTLDFAPGADVPTGNATLTMTRLADLAPLLGGPVAGSVVASLDASSGVARVRAALTDAAVPGAGTVGKAALEATIADPAGHPAIDGVLTVDRAAASGTSAGIGASARLTGKGPLDALAFTLSSEIAGLPGAPARIETSGIANAVARTLSLTSFSGAWKGQSIGLLAPARIGFAQGVWVDKFRLGFRRAELTIAGGLGGGGEVQARGAARGKGGEAASALDVRATLAGLPADIVAIVAPDYAADGTIAGEVRLTGSASRPVGAVRVVASGLRLRSGAGRALPAADLSLGARLDGSSARLDGKLTAGPSSVILAGIAPLGISGRMDLHVDGTVDLAMVDPWLTAEGREARGQLDLALGVGGSLAAPRASGTVRLSNGEIQDAVLGLRVAGISAVFVADGDTVRVDRFDGKAGQGTISVSGTAGLMGMRPVNLTVRATDARILSSDRITAAADADLVLQGPLSGNPGPSGAVQTGAVQPGAVQPGAVQPGALVGRPAQVGTGRGEQGGQSPRGQSLPVQRLPGQSPREQSPAAPNQRTPIPPGLTLSGTVHLRRADIRVPEKLPASIAVLPVRDPEAPPMDRPPSAVMPDIGLNLTLDAPAEIFIRGRGIDAELGGRVLFAGTAARPLPQGGLTLRRGTFSIAGVSLGLTEGAVDFTGAGLVDPTLKLVATSTSATLTSTLTVGGEVKDPKIVLSSVPDLPQDEILSQLLFNTVKARLSPFQLAEIAAALASISGVGSPLGDPLESIRTKLGFDQLSVGTDATGGATLEAGRYIAKGVRIGAKQGTGGDTQAMVQIDIAKGLKLETTAGTGSSSATSTSGTGNGSSVGVTYQFEY
jgi:translocation and assembly module TamB